MEKSKCLWDLQHIEKMMQEHQTRLEAKKQAFEKAIRHQLEGEKVLNCTNSLWEVFLMFEKIHNNK